MGAVVRMAADCVEVAVNGRLAYALWNHIYQASLAAAAAGKPLNIDIAACEGGECGGVASILAAQRRAREVAVCGCHGDFIPCFKAFGVCQGCAQRTDFPPGCPKREAVNRGPVPPAPSFQAPLTTTRSARPASA